MTRTACIEGITQVVILLVMGVMAAAASFKHIHDLAVRRALHRLRARPSAVNVAAVPIRMGTGSSCGEQAGPLALFFPGAAQTSRRH
jgi:hypothetical protein